VTCHADSAITVAEAKKVWTGKGTLWFYGYVSYEDAFERGHEYLYIWYYNHRSAAFAFIPFTKYTASNPIKPNAIRARRASISSLTLFGFQWRLGQNTVSADISGADDPTPNEIYRCDHFKLTRELFPRFAQRLVRSNGAGLTLPADRRGAVRTNRLGRGSRPSTATNPSWPRRCWSGSATTATIMEQPATTAQPPSNEVARTIEMFRPSARAADSLGPMMSVIAGSTACGCTTGAHQTALAGAVFQPTQGFSSVAQPARSRMPTGLQSARAEVRFPHFEKC
jgi:hypothetical protein